MKFLKLISLLFIISIGVLFTSCEETTEVDEYAYWKERNSEYINAIAKEAETNADGKWIKFLSFKLNEKDVNGNYYHHGNECYIYCHKEASGIGTRIESSLARVSVNYRGRLIPTESYPKGLVFDESYKGELKLEGERTNKPVEFYLSQVIVGWRTALLNMAEGDIWRVYIPAKLGYGSTEKANIPAHSTLIFDINLVEVIN